MNEYRNIRTYRETDLQTMSKEKLIVLLYEKMIEHFTAAGVAAGDNRPEMSRRLGLAQRIVTELRSALDHSVGGEIADNLASIYDFLFQEILAMQLDQDPAHADHCMRTLAPLLDAWSNIPAGAGDRELRSRTHPGTEPAAPEPAPASGDDPQRRPLVSISA